MRHTLLCHVDLNGVACMLTTVENFKHLWAAARDCQETRMQYVFSEAC